jgi:hypothetical protein
MGCTCRVNVLRIEKKTNEEGKNAARHQAIKITEIVSDVLLREQITSQYPLSILIFILL